MHRHWQDQATRHPKLIERWFNQHRCNFGILGDDLITVDVDTYNGGALADLPAELPPTNWVIKTGGGGWHLGYIPNGKIVNNARLQQGVDLKARGGFVVAPGGLHVTGGRYTAIALPRDVTVAVPWPGQTPWANRPGGAGTDQAEKGSKSQLAQLLRHPAEPGDRNNHLTRVAGHLAKSIRHEDAFVELLGMANAAMPYPLELAELDKIRVSVWGRERSKPIELLGDWEPIDLWPILDGEGPLTPPPELMARTDGVKLMYEGKTHGFHGEPEACKGWMALTVCKERMMLDERVLYIDFEDSPGTALERLIAMGVARDRIGGLFTYIHPQTPITENAWKVMETALATGPTVCILDGVTEAMVMNNWDPINTRDSAKFMAFPRRIADQGPAVVVIDHVVKNPEGNSRYAFGAQHKLAGVDVQLEFKVVTPFSRNGTGHIHVRLAKDRLGKLREHAAGDMKRVLAELHLSSTQDGNVVTSELRPPAAGKDEEFRPTNLMAKVVEALREQPGMTGRELQLSVKGKDQYIKQARDALLAEGRIERRDEGRNRYTFWLSGADKTGQEDIFDGGSDEG
jgi:hypothetical protein